MTLPILVNIYFCYIIDIALTIVKHNVDRQNLNKQNVNRQNVEQTKCRQTKCRTDKMSTDKMPNRQNVDNFFFLKFF